MLDPSPKSTYLAHPSDWSWLGRRLLESGQWTSPERVCGLDTETIGCNPADDTAVGTARVVVFSIGIADGVLSPRGYRSAEGFVLPPSALDDPFIREWLESADHLKVAHNCRYDRHSLANEGVAVLGLVDTVDLYRIVSPGRDRYGLKALVPDILGQEIIGEFKELFSEPLLKVTNKTVKYRVCDNCDRHHDNRQRKCGKCKTPLTKVETVEQVVKELKTRRQIPLQEICQIGVTEGIDGPLAIYPGEHRLWTKFVDYAGADAIWAAQLWQVRYDQTDGARKARYLVP